MFFLHHFSVKEHTKSMGVSLIVHGLFCALFGVAIIIAPELLAYLVAAFFFIVGVSLVSTGMRMRKWTR